MIKITSLDNGFYQVDAADTPLDEAGLKHMVAAVSGWRPGDVDAFMTTLKAEHAAALTVTADIGTVVNIYEVEYPTPRDPNKATQELAGRLDEYDNFVSQQVFPDVKAEDILVKTRIPGAADSPGTSMPRGLAPHKKKLLRASRWRDILL
jgi:hypothetical protein